MNVSNAEAIAEARLKSRLNIPQDAPLEVDESLEFTATDVDLNSEVDYMFEHRSDLLASRQRIDASRAGCRCRRRRATRPSRARSTTAGTTALSRGGEIFKQNYVWSAGVFLDWNIFDRFQTKANIQNAKAQQRIAEYDLQQAKIDAVLDVRQITLNLEQAMERLGLAEGNGGGGAEENLRLAEERYRVGAGTVLETIEASASLTQAQASLIDARVDYLVNRADLQRATGRPVSSR
jgi:outer membrane protein TolC